MVVDRHKHELALVELWERYPLDVLALAQPSVHIDGQVAPVPGHVHLVPLARAPVSLAIQLVQLLPPSSSVRHDDASGSGVVGAIHVQVEGNPVLEPVDPEELLVAQFLVAPVVGPAPEGDGARGQVQVALDLVRALLAVVEQERALLVVALLRGEAEIPCQGRLGIALSHLRVRREIVEGDLE